jgi:hypothetical protein
VGSFCRRFAVESLQAVLELVPHALNLLDGKTEHAWRSADEIPTSRKGREKWGTRLKAQQRCRVEVGMLRLRSEDRFAIFTAPLSMTVGHFSGFGAFWNVVARKQGQRRRTGVSVPHGLRLKQVSHRAFSLVRNDIVGRGRIWAHRGESCQ